MWKSKLLTLIFVILINIVINYRHAERSDAAANVVVAVRRQRADGAARARRRGGSARTRRRPASRRYGGAALRAPPWLQGATLPAAAALRLPA